jgi:hypothetical protein
MPHAGPLLEAPIQLSKLLHVGLNDRPALKKLAAGDHAHHV